MGGKHLDRRHAWNDSGLPHTRRQSQFSERNKLCHWRGATNIQTMSDTTAPTVGQQRLVSPRVGEQIAEELERSANIIASYYEKHKSEMPANVACALTREMTRLRDLASKVKPSPKDDDEEG